MVQENYSKPYNVQEYLSLSLCFQCGSRATVQLAAVMLLGLGLFLQLTQLLTSVPLAIHGDHTHNHSQPLILTLTSYLQIL